MRQLIFTSAITLFTAVLAIGQVNLKYNWKAGETYRFEATQEDDITMSAMGMKMNDVFNTATSFALQVKDDMMYLVYNESAKQYFDKEERSEMKGKDKRSYLTLLVSIDNKGEYEKEILLNNSVDKVYTVPKLCEQISKNKMLIYSYSKKGQKFGTMTVQE